MLENLYAGCLDRWRYDTIRYNTTRYDTRVYRGPKSSVWSLWCVHGQLSL